MQKWGKNRNGSIRFRCKYCSVSKTRKRSDLSQKYQKQLFVFWLLSKLSLWEISVKYNVSSKTLFRWFQPFWNEEPQVKLSNISNKVMIIDGKCVGKNATVLVGTVDKKVVFWLFVQRENYSSWKVFLQKLKHIPFAIVGDGQKGMHKAIKEVFPRVLIQRCQFHVIKYIRSKLTKNPESIAAIELKKLVLEITNINTREELKDWLTNYKYWWLTYKYFVKEKTYPFNSFTLAGRPRWHYTHQKLHASHSHLKNALPYLFRYLQHPEIPNTTNFVEGGINSPMQEKLRSHRGLKLLKRRILIAHFLGSKQ